MTLITDLKRIDHVIDRSEGRPQSEYWGYYEDQLIGIKSTNVACEKMLDDYAYDLLSSDLHISATALDGTYGDCGATLDGLGLCGCRAEEPRFVRFGTCDEPHYQDGVCGHRFPLPEDPNGIARCPACGSCAIVEENAAIVETPRHTIACICGKPALIIMPEGAFCGKCFAAQDIAA